MRPPCKAPRRGGALVIAAALLLCTAPLGALAATAAAQTKKPLTTAEVLAASAAADWRRSTREHALSGAARRPRHHRAGAAVRPAPRRERHCAGARPLLRRLSPSCARRTTTSCSGAIRTGKKPRDRRRHAWRPSSSAAARTDLHQARRPGQLRTRWWVSRRFPGGRRPATGVPGRCTATAWSAPVATTTSTPAAAPNSTS